MAKKGSSNLLYGVVIGGVAMYFLKDTVQGFVQQAKGAAGMRGRSLTYKYY